MNTDEDISISALMEMDQVRLDTVTCGQTDMTRLITIYIHCAMLYTISKQKRGDSRNYDSPDRDGTPTA
jgi:hypothetical protein